MGVMWVSRGGGGGSGLVGVWVLEAWLEVRGHGCEGSEML